MTSEYPVLYVFALCYIMDVLVIVFANCDYVGKKFKANVKRRFVRSCLSQLVE